MGHGLRRDAGPLAGLLQPPHGIFLGHCPRAAQSAQQPPRRDGGGARPGPHARGIPAEPRLLAGGIRPAVAHDRRPAVHRAGRGSADGAHARAARGAARTGRSERIIRGPRGRPMRDRARRRGGGLRRRSDAGAPRREPSSRPRAQGHAARRYGAALAARALYEGAAEIRGSDTGAGIAAEHLPRVFDRFSRSTRASRVARAVHRSGGAVVGRVSAARRERKALRRIVPRPAARLGLVVARDGVEGRFVRSSRGRRSEKKSSARSGCLRDRCRTGSRAEP